MATILQCAHLSAVAYRPIQERTKWLEKNGLQWENDLSSRNGYQGFIASSSDTMFIVFEGTASTKDWTTDAKALKNYVCFFDDDQLVGIHIGFYHLFTDVWPQIKSYMDTHLTNKKIVLTGHSLGGAIATLVAAPLRVHDLEIVTFGCPRVGNRAFMKKYNDSVPLSTRVVRDLDVVPRMPKFDYWHVDTLLHLTDEGKPISFWKSLLKQGWYVYKNTHGFLSKEALDDHSMDGYVKAVELMK
jgi:predicted lipase